MPGEIGPKSQFVLSFTPDTPTEVIVKKGLAKGFELTAKQIGNIRFQARKRSGKPAPLTQKGRRDSKAMPRGAKTEFILAHSDKTPQEIADLATKQGMYMTKGMVWTMRHQAQQKAEKSTALAVAPTRAVVTTKPNGTINKAAFVNAMPPDWPAEKVVERAQARGIVITQQYVRQVRWHSANPKGRTKAAAPKGLRQMGFGFGEEMDATEKVLRDAIAELGPEYATQVFRDVAMQRASAWAGVVNALNAHLQTAESEP